MSGETKTKTVKVVLTVEAEVDPSEGFDEDELRNVASGYLWMMILRFADVGSYKRGAVHQLREGAVSFRKPKVVGEDE